MDKDIDSTDLARLRGKAILAQSAFAKEQGRAIITQDGLASGMYISITDSQRGINSNYLIHRLTTRFLGNQVAQYTLDFGEYNPDLVDLLIELKRQSDPYMEKRDDEVLNELLELSESLTSDDGTPTATATGPRYYVSPATSGDPIKAGFWKCSA
jgi:hypothetical protein